VRNNNNDYKGTPEGLKEAATGLCGIMHVMPFCFALALELPLDYFSKTIDSMDLCVHPANVVLPTSY